MCRELELVKCKDVVAIDGRGIGILQEGAKVIACTGEVCWIWRGVEGVLPCAVVVQVGAEGFVGGFPQSMGGEVEGNGEMLVLLDGGTKPLLAVLGEVVMGQEGHCQWDVWLRWREVAVDQGFVEDVKSSAAARFLQICGHTPDCVHLDVRVAAASYLFCCLKRGCGVFGKVAKKLEGVMLSGSVEVWFSEGVLALSKASEKSFVGG